MVYGIGSTFGLGTDTSNLYSIEVVSDADLVRFVENLKKQVRFLRLENEVLEASIMRLQPSLMSATFSALALKLSQSGFSMDSTCRSRFALTDFAQSTSNIKSQSRISHRILEPSLRSSSVKMSRSIIGGTGPKINIEEKLELVHAIMENQNKDLKEFKNTSAKRTAYLNSQFEEIGLRTIDFDNWTQEFEQQVVNEGVEAMTKRIPAETWIRFMTEHGKKLDKQIYKMRLRTSTAKVQHRKLREDIKRKKELVSLLLPIDIEIKKIEIAKARRVMERDNTYIHEAKAIQGNANLNLTRHRDDLMTITNYLKKLQQLKKLRVCQTEKMDAERALLEDQVNTLQQSLNWIQEQRKAYLVPEVLDYVRVKLEIRELNNSIKRMETSLSIKQYAITSIKRRSLNLSKISLRKTNLKSTRKPKNASDVCEVPSRVTQINAPMVCRPCGLLPRD